MIGDRNGRDSRESRTNGSVAALRRGSPGRALIALTLALVVGVGSVTPSFGIWPFTRRDRDEVPDPIPYTVEFSFNGGTNREQRRLRNSSNLHVAAPRTAVGHGRSPCPRPVRRLAPHRRALPGGALFRADRHLHRRASARVVQPLRHGLGASGPGRGRDHAGGALLLRRRQRRAAAARSVAQGYRSRHRQARRLRYDRRRRDRHRQRLASSRPSARRGHAARHHRQSSRRASSTCRSTWRRDRRPTSAGSRSSAPTGSSRCSSDAAPASSQAASTRPTSPPGRSGGSATSASSRACAW